MAKDRKHPPTIREVAPEIGELEDRRRELRDALTEAEQKLRAARAELEAQASRGEVGAVEFATAVRQRGREAVALLERKNPSGRKVEELEAEVARLRKAVAKVDEAVENVRESSASARLKAEILPLRDASLERLAAALEELAAAAREHDRLRRHWNSETRFTSRHAIRWFSLRPTARAGLDDLGKRIAEKLGREDNPWEFD